jgi:glucose-6-phosphate-specific signal transduction histidine kinase
MLLIVLATLAAVAVMAVCPETDTARVLRRWLVEAPARWLDRMAIWRLLFFAGVLAAGVAMTILFEFEGLLVYALTAPEILIWAIAFDVGLLIEALLISAALLASNGLRVAALRVRILSSRVVTVLRRRNDARTPSDRVRRPPKKPSDDDRPAWAQPPYRPFSIA